MTGAMGASSPAAGGAPTRRPSVVTVSSGPGQVTGGDVLVRVSGTTRPRITIDGARAAAEPRGHDRWLVSGLRLGRNRIVVAAGDEQATLVVTNHPRSGPVFSGPHLPLLCTETSPSAEARAAATCAAEPVVEYVYRSTTTNRFEPLDDPRAPPAPAATLVLDGHEVPYVVRVERGVLNRSPYSTAVLADGWNRRLVYQFGGGCGTAYSQGSSLGTDVLDDALLSRGYATATANFNTFQTSCNDVLSAETAMMVKERFTETVGPPRFTIGSGVSGGAIQQLLIAQNYPGILDALSPVLPFPDQLTTAAGVSDCGLLERFWASPDADGWTEAQRVAVNGHASPVTCPFWVSSFLGNIVPGQGCDPAIPAAQIWSRENRDGIRCTLQDYNRNELGVNTATGYARRPLDNVGVQYGLEALEDGTITVEQFLTLNAHIGGYDINGVPVARREAATRRAVRRAYSTGRVLGDSPALDDLPIIMVNLYSDPFGDIHDRFRLFSIRARLTADEDRGNITIWTRGSDGDAVAAAEGAAFSPVETTVLLDEWLTSGERPAPAVDNCVDTQGEVIRGDDVYEAGPCKELFPVHGDPRIAAGAPITNDVIKCRRVPVRADAYGVDLRPEQLRRLRGIFPMGVCDWTKRGVGQVPTTRTWIDYGRPPFAPRPAES